MNRTAQFICLAHTLFDAVRVVFNLARYLVVGEQSDPEGRVLRGE